MYLFKGNVIILGRKSENSLYDTSLVSFDEKGQYNQKDAEGFIKINSLRLKKSTFDQQNLRAENRSENASSKIPKSTFPKKPDCVNGAN